MDSTYNLRTPLTICGFRLQFADSTYICGFQDSINLLNTHIMICLGIPQTVPDSANFWGLFYGSNFMQYSVLAIYFAESKTAKKIKEK